MRRAAAAILLLGGSILAAPGASAQIIGGAPEYEDPEVVGVLLDGGCSGTVIAPRVVITAAHCVKYTVDHELWSWADVTVGRSWYDPDVTLPVIDAVYHRQYDEDGFGQYDVAIVRLGQDAPVAPAIVNGDPVEEGVQIGGTVHSVGFGVDELDRVGYKKSAEIPVKGIYARHLIIGAPDLTICNGDSGGPDFGDFAGERRVVSVHSYGRIGCTSSSVSVRVDRVYDRFILPVLAAWDGPCRHDGVCTTEGCALPDPDCDDCGYQGICKPNCPLPDLDCPLDRMLGAFCSQDTDCESRLCAPAPDDPRIGYCSDVCDPAQPNDVCAGDMDCVPDETRGLCRFRTPTPSAQGSFCNSPDDCRSVLCDEDQSICVEPCDPAAGEAACAAGFTCQSSELADHVCRKPEPAACGAARSSTPARSPGWIALIAIAAAALAARRITRARSAWTRSGGSGRPARSPRW